MRHRWKPAGAGSADEVCEHCGCVRGRVITTTPKGRVSSGIRYATDGGNVDSAYASGHALVRVPTCKPKGKRSNV